MPLLVKTYATKKVCWMLAGNIGLLEEVVIEVGDDDDGGGGGGGGMLCLKETKELFFSWKRGIAVGGERSGER